jgi:hypothetical protein
MAPKLSLVLVLLLIAGCIPNARADAGEPWQDPIQEEEEGPISGEWQLLHAKMGVSAMHMQLLPGDLVLMFDRTDTGPSNLSLPVLPPVQHPPLAPTARRTRCCWTSGRTRYTRTR